MLQRMVRAVTRSERGAAAVEMALVLPLLVVLGLGAAELARTIWQYQVVTKGVRDVAENLVKSGTKTSSTPILPTYADADFDIAVTCNDDEDLGEVRLIRMTVVFPFDELFAGFLGLSDLTFNITHEQIHVGE